MILPTIALRRNVDPEQSVQRLKERATNIVYEAQPTTPELAERRDAYVRATTTTETVLRSVFSMKDCANLFDNPRHRDICSMPLGSQLLPMISADSHWDSWRLDLLDSNQFLVGLLDSVGRLEL